MSSFGGGKFQARGNIQPIGVVKYLKLISRVPLDGINTDTGNSQSQKVPNPVLGEGEACFIPLEELLEGKR